MIAADVQPEHAIGAVAAAVLAGAALAVPLSQRARAAAMLLALAVTPVLLLHQIWDSEQVATLRDQPGLAAGAAGAGLLVVAGLALLMHGRPMLFGVLAVAALPFRVPIAAGGTTSSLLVPLYAVIAAGVLAYAVPRLAGREGEDGEAPPGLWLRRLLALAIVLYAVQAAYSSDFERALGQVVFFYVPFALLATLFVRLDWNRRMLLQCLGVLAALAVLFVAIGYVEYATRTLLLNPKVIASNQFETYFRVNSLFFDPNIYGRFLAVVMLLVAAALVWARRPRTVAACGVLLAFLWGGLVLTLSQSSFAGLLVGLLVLGGLRWGTRRAAVAAGAVAVVGVVAVLAAPGQLGMERGANEATSGRYDLVRGGVELAADRPVAGWGAGSFRREYREQEYASTRRATAASHTIPVTVAAEQGVIGLAVYLALLAAALALLLRGARTSVARAGIAAAFVALVAHTLMYAAFLEDPLTWALLGAGAALARDAPADP
jgi:O-antigen ligase